MEYRHTYLRKTNFRTADMFINVAKKPKSKFIVINGDVIKFKFNDLLNFMMKKKVLQCEKEKLHLLWSINVSDTKIMSIDENPAIIS